MVMCLMCLCLLSILRWDSFVYDSPVYYEKSQQRETTYIVYMKLYSEHCYTSDSATKRNKERR